MNKKEQFCKSCLIFITSVFFTLGGLFVIDRKPFPGLLLISIGIIDLLCYWISKIKKAEKELKKEIQKSKSTEEKLNHSYERLQIAQQFGKIATFEWNIKSNEVKWSNGYEALYDHSNSIDQWSQKAWFKKVHPKDRKPLIRAINQAVQKDNVFYYEFRIVTPEKLIRWIVAKAKIIRSDSGEPKFMIGVNIDITEQKESLHKSLKVNKELTKLNHIRSEFTSMVTHELRTPLTAIKESISLVYDGLEGPVNFEQKETLKLAKNNVDRLSRLIQNILDYSKIESGNFELSFQKCHINVLLKETCLLMNLAARKKNIKIDVDFPKENIALECDEDKIKQVLINLIDNALKFCPPDKGHILVALSSSENKVTVSVTDNGVGIRQKDQQKIFHMFTQSSCNAAGWNTGGTGVGLAVCKKLIEQHGGDISVQSQLHVGSTFSFELPIKQRTTLENSLVA